MISLASLGLIFDILGAAFLFWGARYIPRWVYNKDKDGREILDRDTTMSPGILWRRFQYSGVSSFLIGFLLQIIGNEL